MGDSMRIKEKQSDKGKQKEIIVTEIKEVNAKKQEFKLYV